jgi:hypothetical protein
MRNCGQQQTNPASISNTAFLGSRSSHSWRGYPNLSDPRYYPADYLASALAGRSCGFRSSAYFHRTCYYLLPSAFRPRNTGTEVRFLEYAPTFRLEFRDGSNEYRVIRDRVKFRTDSRAWCLLDEAEIEMHLIPHTEVASWLRKTAANMLRVGR